MEYNLGSYHGNSLSKYGKSLIPPYSLCCMKKNIILIFIILFFLLSGCEKNIQPEALNGVLDLSEWDLKKDKPVELKGE